MWASLFVAHVFSFGPLIKGTNRNRIQHLSPAFLVYLRNRKGEILLFVLTANFEKWSSTCLGSIWLVAHLLDRVANIDCSWPTIVNHLENIFFFAGLYINFFAGLVVFFVTMVLLGKNTLVSFFSRLQTGPRPPGLRTEYLGSSLKGIQELLQELPSGTTPYSEKWKTSDKKNLPYFRIWNDSSCSHRPQDGNIRRNKTLEQGIDS